MLRFVTLVIGLLVSSATGVVGQEVDPHRIYENSCSGCHSPHSGDFVWDELNVSDGVLVGARSGRAVEIYLRSGHGGVTPDKAEVLLAHFRIIRDSGGIFIEKCRICHVTAVELVRNNLILDEGKLTGRYTGRDIGAFLDGHGRLSPEEVSEMLSVLTRVANSQGLTR